MNDLCLFNIFYYRKLTMKLKIKTNRKFRKCIG